MDGHTEAGGAKWESRRLAQSLAVRVVELESENRRLREEVTSLTESYSALASKNKLFEAKLLELQARMLHAPMSKGQKARFRSPLIRADDGNWIYRFERGERPQSARRVWGGAHVPATVNTGGETDRSMSAADRKDANGQQNAVPPTVPKAHRSQSARRTSAMTRISNNSGMDWRGKDGTFSAYGHRARPPPPLTASANPGSVQRVFREHDRIASPRMSAELQKPVGDAGNSNTSASLDTSASGRDLSMVSKGQGNVANAGLDVLRKDLEDGLIDSQTRLIIQVDYCIDEGSRALTVRHNPAKYREVSEQLDRAVAVTFKGWRVEMQVTAHDWSATPEDSAPVGVPPTSGKWMPPLGAFEVFLAWDVLDAKRSVLLHSKLQTRKFPDVFDMLASVVRLVGTHSAVLASSSQHM